jgi:hypothetical protein
MSGELRTALLPVTACCCWGVKCSSTCPAERFLAPATLCSQSLLQQELHRTSQFAIKLSDKFKAKRDERDQAQQQLDAALE